MELFLFCLCNVPDDVGQPTQEKHVSFLLLTFKVYTSIIVSIDFWWKVRVGGAIEKELEPFLIWITLMWSGKFRLWAAFLWGVPMRTEDMEQKMLGRAQILMGYVVFVAINACRMALSIHTANSPLTPPPPPPLRRSRLWLVRRGVSWKEVCEM